MGIRDEELLRLRRYVEGMGIKVFYHTKPVKNSVGATWDMENNLITLFIAKRDSKIDTILNFIHEIGHQISFVHDDNRTHPKGLLEAQSKENMNKPLTKRERRLILESELKGLKWWSVIYDDTHMKFPKYKLYLAREFDTWWYMYFYQVGRYPTTREKRAKYKELRGIYNKDMDIRSYEVAHGL